MPVSPDPNRQFAPKRVFAKPSGPNGQGPWSIYQIIQLHESKYGDRWQYVGSPWLFENCPTLEDAPIAWKVIDEARLRLCEVCEQQAYPEHVFLGEGPDCIDLEQIDLKLYAFGSIQRYVCSNFAPSNDPDQRALQLQVPDDTRQKSLLLSIPEPDQIPVEHSLAEHQTELRVSGNRIDCAWIAKTFPDIKTLGLSAHPKPICILENFSALKNLKNIERFEIRKCFGYAVEDIPTQEDWPNWDCMFFYSIPKDVHDHMKTRQWVFTNFEVRSPRMAAWVAANVNNPFSIWDGRDNISQKALKATTRAYQKLLTAFVKIGKAKTVDTEKAVDAVTLFTQTMNELPNASLETQEREEIGDILYRACDDSFDEDVLEKLMDAFDQVRDF